jgi:hypothetical protein
MQENFPKALLLLAIGLTASTAFSQTQIPNLRTGQTPRSAIVQKDVPAEFKAAIAALASSKSNLEKAGDKWGGHRVKAIHEIDQIFREVGQPQAPSSGEMKSGSVDEPAVLQSGIASLNTAKADFERSGNQWGGRRVKAISGINAALQELQTGIEYAKSHKTY